MAIILVYQNNAKGNEFNYYASNVLDFMKLIWPLLT